MRRDRDEDRNRGRGDRRGDDGRDRNRDQDRDRGEKRKSVIPTGSGSSSPSKNNRPRTLQRLDSVGQPIPAAPPAAKAGAGTAIGFGSTTLVSNVDGVDEVKTKVFFPSSGDVEKDERTKSEMKQGNLIPRCLTMYGKHAIVTAVRA